MKGITNRLKTIIQIQLRSQLRRARTPNVLKKFEEKNNQLFSWLLGLASPPGTTFSPSATCPWLAPSSPPFIDEASVSGCIFFWSSILASSISATFLLKARHEGRSRRCEELGPVVIRINRKEVNKVNQKASSVGLAQLLPLRGPLSVQLFLERSNCPIGLIKSCGQGLG